MSTILNKVLERHITRNGYRCMIVEGNMVIYVPDYDEEYRLIGYKAVKVTSMVECYKAMGYSHTK